MNRVALKKNLMSWAVPAVALLILFIISFGVRWEAFRAMPQGYGFYNAQHQRWINAEVNSHVLYVLSMYRAHPPAQHQFAPYFFGTNDPTDTAFLHNPNLTGSNVYTSFAPTVFIVPYALFKILGTPLTYTALELFSLAIHFACIALIHGLLRVLLPARGHRKHLIPILGASVYTFSTVALHNHMSVYWSHQLLQPVYLAAMLRFAQTRGTLRLREVLLWGAALPLISWTGFVMDLAFALHFGAQYLRLRTRDWILRFATLAAAGLTALVAIVSQILLVTGASLSAYFDKIANRVEARSFDAGYTTLPKLIESYVIDVAYDTGAYVLIALFLVTSYFYLVRRVPRLKSFTFVILLMSLVPLLETIPLIEHDAVYGFGRLKLLLPLILLLCLTADGVLRHVNWSKRYIVLIAICFAVPAAAHSYLYIDIYGNRHDTYRRYLNLPPPAHSYFAQ
jgi:hypothetical protein